MSACDAEALLVVDLRTNLVPLVEFDRIELDLYPGSRLAGSPSRTLAGPAVGPWSNLFEGIRLAEIRGLARGTWLLRARLLQRGEERATGLVLVDWRERARAVTILVTRECAGVECPPDGSPGDIACLAGRCVDPRCSPESPELCPRECTLDSECEVPPDAPPCAVPWCASGGCGVFYEPNGCGGAPCLPDRGCERPPSDGGIEPPSFVLQLTAGTAHTCALVPFGEVRCWGSNARGQLGDGTATQRSTPVPVVGITEAVRIDAGENHTCAVLSSREVVCWGDNRSGQLGDGTTMSRSAPVRVSGLSDVLEVSAGARHTCATRDAGDTGEVLCWGGNADGQLGNGTTDPTLTPLAVGGLGAAGQVRVGSDHSCALGAGPTGVMCWGMNGDGQLGDGTRMTRLSPVPLSGGALPVELGLGRSHTCVAFGAGDVMCAGSNAFGQLGGGPGPDQLRLLPVASLPGPVVELHGGDAFTCALAFGGTLYCWGDNSLGQLGIGSTAPVSEPRAVTGFVPRDRSALGGSHACAVLEEPTGPQVHCWGQNTFGQLGDGSETDRSSPVPVAGL